PTARCATMSAVIFCPLQSLSSATITEPNVGALHLFHMTSLSTDHPIRPIHRVAKELVASSGFLLARLGFAFKAKAIATMEEAGFELYDYSVLAMLAEGILETPGQIGDTLDADPRR